MDAETEPLLKHRISSTDRTHSVTERRHIQNNLDGNERDVFYGHHDSTSVNEDMHHNNFLSQNPRLETGLPSSDQQPARSSHNQKSLTTTDSFLRRCSHSSYINELERSANDVTDVPKPAQDGNRDMRIHDDGKKCLVLLTAVSFFVACAGKLHSPVLTQYIYQLYTQSVYGNQSTGVHISKHPCVNDSASNSSIDPRNQEVQDKSANLLMNLDLVSGSIGIVANLLLGSYSDVLGRRFMLLVPFLGHFLRNATTPVIIYWDLGLSALYVGYVADGLCGGYPAICLGLYACTADISTSGKQRTLAMAIIETSLGLTVALTNIGAGYFIQYTGFFYPSLVASLLLLGAVVVIVLWLPETVSRDRKRWMSPLKSAKRVVGVFVPPDKSYHRALLLLALLVFFLGKLPDKADNKLRTLYVMDEPFCWSSVQIGYFQGAKDGSAYLMSLFFIQLLRGCVVTPLLAIMGALSYLGVDVLMALAWDDLMIYMVSVMGVASCMLIPSLCSLMSSLVSSDKQGALFAAVAMVESLCMGLAQFIFLNVYRKTVDIMHGLVYLIIGGLHLLIIFILLVCLCLYRKTEPSQTQTMTIQVDEGAGS